MSAASQGGTVTAQGLKVVGGWQGGQEIPQPSCSSRVSRGWRLGHTPCRAPGLHPASPHTSYVTLGKVVFRVFYFFIFFNFCKSLFEPN